MTFSRVLLAFLVAACWLLCVSVAQNQDHVVTVGNDTATKLKVNSTGTDKNTTETDKHTTGTDKHTTGTDKDTTETNKNNYMGNFRLDALMIRRALYVLVGFSMILLLYFLIRAVRVKKPSQKKKYGLLSNYDDSVEMEEVDSEEDDTLYEARSLRR